MALSEFETKKAEKAIQGFLAKRRPLSHIRHELDIIGYRIAGKSVELFEIRPRWDKPEEKLEHSIAKATFVKSTEVWNVFWQRADLKWLVMSRHHRLVLWRNAWHLLTRTKARMFLRIDSTHNNVFKGRRAKRAPLTRTLGRGRK